jgi:hypothetical protein
MRKKNRAHVGVFAIAALSLWNPIIFTQANEASKQEKTMNNSRRDMIRALEAAGPHPSLGVQAQTFDRFVGTWDCDYANYNDDGTTERTRGEVIFGWILNGRAVQDIWTWLDKNGEREIGTTIRFFDPKVGKWRIVWADATNHIIKTLSGGAADDRIVLEGAGDDGSRIRWSFNEIRKDSFVWRGEKSRDDGKTWRLAAEYHLKRRSAATASENKS